MVDIEYKVDRKYNDYILRVRGHAGYAPYGNDIVCAAVSVLVQTLYITGADKNESRIDAGDVFIHGWGEDSVKIFDVILVGLQMIQMDYPKFVSIKGCTINRKKDLK